MSRENQTTTQDQQVKYTPTPEEEAYNKILLNRAQATDSQQTQVQQSGLSLINQLLTGQNLPGYLNQLPGGISEDVTQSIVGQSLKDVRPGLQAQGLFDSGTRAALETRTASDIRTQAEQFNLQNMQQLLNLAVGGQAQIQAPIQAGGSQLSGALAGLRGINQSGSSNVSSMNPFLKSFQTSLGQTLGAPKFSAGPFSFGG